MSSRRSTSVRRTPTQQHSPQRWFVTRQGEANQFTQYQHLADLQKLLIEEPTLRTAVGRDYHVKPDIMIGVPSQWTGTAQYTLHAAVSSKLTIRSDRAQNIRVEFGTLVRNRRGRLPHLVVVTAEPLPSRIISIARGTGEIDAIYHLLFDEMNEAMDALAAGSSALRSQADDWREMVDMQRVRPYGELADVLALG
nr:NgoMIV family type II restriction endonuclease [Actinoplanes sp. TFC3]